MAPGTVCVSAGSSKNYKTNSFSCSGECLCYPVMKRGPLNPVKEVKTPTYAEVLSSIVESVAVTNLGVTN